MQTGTTRWRSAATRLSDISVSAPYAGVLPNAASGAIWLFLISIFTPAEMTIYLGDTKLTPGRIALFILLIPALVELFRKGRHFVAADFLALATCAWMILIILQTDQASLSSAIAMAVEFIGGYFVARAFLLGRPALDTFVRALRIVAIVLIFFAFLEHLTGEVVVYNAVARLWGQPEMVAERRHGLPRAFSVFPHPILYGTFCVIAGTIFLFCERSPRNKALYGGLCFFGCMLAMSSAPLMSFMLVLSTFTYDRLLQRYAWRWRALMLCVAAFVLVVFLLANKPISWMIANMTLDPATGYFRVGTWDNAIYHIEISPIVGYGFAAYSEDFFANASVDSVWLVLALRFGLPFVALIILMNVAAFYPSASAARVQAQLTERQLSSMRTGFTMTLAMFMFTGVTVHYWNNVWMLWGVCIGVRAGFQEYAIGAARALIPRAARQPAGAIAGGRQRSLAQPNRKPLSEAP
jgi:hypothetical protein